MNDIIFKASGAELPISCSAIDLNIISRYDLSGPRYTSYPTAPQFKESFNADAYHEAVKRSNKVGRDLSLYFHIPFCDTVCYYCACNKIVTANKKRAIPYLARLNEEIATKAEFVDAFRPVTQLHWGGGTPTYISDEQMSALMACTRKYFNLLNDDTGEYSIEVHPGLVSAETISHLRRLGFNRLSIGVQDFNHSTQKAVNRFNSVEDVKLVVDRAREEKFHSISMDLIYGLPYQNLRTLASTLRHIIEFSPERISLFSYAHLPSMFKVQRQIDESTLPGAQEKLNMLSLAIETLVGAGYVYIGMDHFAKPDDELALAQASGELQRGFQGYSTQGGTDLFAFGVSAISYIDDVYVQNYKALEEYNQAVDTQNLPIAKGYALNTDDKIRYQVIHQLICHFSLDFQTIENTYNIDFNEYFKREIDALQSMVDDELITLDCDKIVVESSGRLLIRRICMVFDAYMQPDAQSFSKII